MLISDKIVFVELHKTGSTRVQKLIAEIGGALDPGKHATYANELAGLGKPVVGYVCEPLAWYLALWKFGCSSKGDLYKRLTDPAKWSNLEARRASRLKDGAKLPAGREIPEGWGAVHAKTVWYASPDNPAAFREWLQAVLVKRGIRRLVDHSYNNSPVQRLAGLMTYEYFMTFVRDAENMEKSVDSQEALAALNQQQAITSHFVRAEHAGEDFQKVVQELGLVLSEEQLATVKGWAKDKAAAREKEWATYYDADSRRLVLKREKFINRLFGYSTAMPDGSEVASELEGAGGEAAVKPPLTKEEKVAKKLVRTERQATRAAKQEGGATAPAEGVAKSTTAPAKKTKAAAKKSPKVPTQAQAAKTPKSAATKSANKAARAAKAAKAAKESEEP